LIDKAEECKLANQDAYHGYLANKFGRMLGVTEQLLLLMRLPFKAVVTTNFDPQLNELATTKEGFELQAYPGLDARRLWSGEQTGDVPVFYIHGIGACQ
jgi:hypothetical protein